MPCLHPLLVTHLILEATMRQHRDTNYCCLLRLPDQTRNVQVPVPDNIMMIITSLLGECRGLPGRHVDCQGGEIHLHGPLRCPLDQLPTRPELRAVT